MVMAWFDGIVSSILKTLEDRFLLVSDFTAFRLCRSLSMLFMVYNLQGIFNFQLAFWLDFIPDLSPWLFLYLNYKS